MQYFNSSVPLVYFIFLSMFYYVMIFMKPPHKIIIHVYFFMFRLLSFDKPPIMMINIFWTLTNMNLR